MFPTTNLALPSGSRAFQAFQACADSRDLRRPGGQALPPQRGDRDTGCLLTRRAGGRRCSLLLPRHQRGFCRTQCRPPERRTWCAFAFMYSKLGFILPRLTQWVQSVNCGMCPPPTSVPPEDHWVLLWSGLPAIALGCIFDWLSLLFLGDIFPAISGQAPLPTANNRKSVPDPSSRFEPLPAELLNCLLVISH